MGKPLSLLPWWNLKRSFCRSGNLGFYGFRGTKSAFRGIWKLERLIWERRNLGLWCGVKLRDAFWDRWKLRGGFLRVWKLSLLAH